MQLNAQNIIIIAQLAKHQSQGHGFPHVERWPPAIEENLVKKSKIDHCNQKLTELSKNLRKFWEIFEFRENSIELRFHEVGVSAAKPDLHCTRF